MGEPRGCNISCSLFKVRGEIAHKYRKSGFDRCQRATDRGSVRCDGAQWTQPQQYIWLMALMTAQSIMNSDVHVMH